MIKLLKYCKKICYNINVIIRLFKNGKIMNIKQYKAIIEEIKYYSFYDKIFGKHNIENLINKISFKNFNNFLKYEKDWQTVLLQYFYSHITMDGIVSSLEVTSKQIKKINENYSYYEEINDLFINELLKNNKPLYFLDVDNTLTDNAHLSKEKISFIKDWENKQNIILSTGKIAKSIMEVINKCEIGDNYYSCLNGSVIWYQGEYTILSKIGAASKKIIDELIQTDLPFITYYEDAIKIIKPLNDESFGYLEKFDELYFDENNDIEYDRIVKVLLHIKDDNTKESKEAEEVVKKIVSKYDNLVCVRTAFHCFEILNKNQHKGNSVKKICELQNTYYRCSIGVGDSMNDLAMLNYVGFPYVVSNVSNELKTYNFKILKGSRDTDIVNVLKKYYIK